MTLSEELIWRGQIKDKTFEKVEWLDDPKIFYLGSDCSSDSLTIGNLAIYMLARRLRKHGWKTVLLVGGATSLIGDPGGKDSERELKSKEEIYANAQGIANQVQRLFGDLDFTPVNNYDWFKDIKFLEFLRDVGKNYSMTELLQRDFIATRLGDGGSGISYAEFSYNLIQGYDFWHLYKEYGVIMQIGGSDQWGNMLSGVPLIRKKSGVEAHAMSMPLVINKATGKKFGKSEDGAVWLDETKTSVYKFYQFWINVDDDGVEDYLKIYTELDKDQIDTLIKQHRLEPGARHAQRRLAYEVTAIVHGVERAKRAEKITESLFRSNDFSQWSAEEFLEMKNDLPYVQATTGQELATILHSLGLAGSKSEARRLLEANAIYINGSQLPLAKTTLDTDDAINEHCIIRKGKNSFGIVHIQN